jgi:geranylgeranylglycerol-phosphate geranylgeranyltransferase
MGIAMFGREPVPAAVQDRQRRDGIVGLLMGVLIAAGTGILDHWQPIAFASVAVFSFIAGGNSLNDYTDREVDKLAHPERPLPSGRMTPRQVLLISIASFVISFLSSLFLNLESIIIVVLAILLNAVL